MSFTFNILKCFLISAYLHVDKFYNRNNMNLFTFRNPKYKKTSVLNIDASKDI